MTSHDEQNVIWANRRSDAVASAIRRSVPEGLTAMDFGCGPGHVGLRLVDHFASVLFVDSDPEVVAALAPRLVGTPSLSVRRLDIVSEPLPDPVECVFASMSLHHVVDLDAVLDAFFRVIDADGWLFIADLVPDGGRYHAAEPQFRGHNGFDPVALAEQTEAHGFDRVRTAPLVTGQRWAGERLIDYSMFGLLARRP